MQAPILPETILHDRYCLIRNLGKIGKGHTYLVEDQVNPGDRKALKEFVLDRASLPLAQIKALFQQEAFALFRLKHPQIPQFQGLFAQDQRLFLVRDYVAGKSYRQLLTERQRQAELGADLKHAKHQSPTFSELEIRQLLIDLLPVLNYLHSRGILHQDLSPDNLIQRASDNLPALVDFGFIKAIIQKLSTGHPKLKVVGGRHPISFIGTLGYVPLEQLEAGIAYPCSDLYALAATCVVLLTGKDPDRLYDSQTKIWSWEKWAPVNIGFARILNRMLNHRPGERYQSASEVMVMLQRLPPLEPEELEELPSNTEKAPQSRNPSVIYLYDERSRHWRRLRKGLKLGAIATAIAAGAGLVGWLGVNLFLDQLPYGLGQSRPATNPASTLESPPADVPPPAVFEEDTPATFPASGERLSPAIGSAKPSEPLDPELDKLLQVTGELSGYDTMDYVITSQANQDWEIRLTGNDIAFSIVDANQQPIQDRADLVQYWQGSLVKPGTYTIQLIAIGDRTEPYTLNVTAKGSN